MRERIIMNKIRVYNEEETADLPLFEEDAQRFCGSFYNPGYGVLTFTYENAHLRLKYGLMDQEFTRTSDSKFVAFEAEDTRTFRANFNADGSLSMRLSTDAVCWIHFDKVQ